MNETTHMLTFAVGAALATGALTFPVTMPTAMFDGQSPNIAMFETVVDEPGPFGEEDGGVCIVPEHQDMTGSYAAPLQVPRQLEDYKPATSGGRRTCAAPFEPE